jgi:hypothetical protein
VKARDPITRLQTAIDCLPVRTRRAMLDGIRAEEIVVGAYTDSRGGICPMLAAHRRGGRTTFVSFARAWDAFARTKRVRGATARELRVLENLLVASLEGDSVVVADPVHEPQQVQRREGLGEEEVGARGPRVALGGAAGVGGEHDDGGVGGPGLRAHAPAGLDAVQPRHVDVEEDDLGLDLARALDRLEAVAGLAHAVARDVLERGGDEPADAGVVVDDEDRVVHESPLLSRSNVSSAICS